MYNIYNIYIYNFLFFFTSIRMPDINNKALDNAKQWLKEQKEMDEKAGTKDHRKVLYSILKNNDLFVKAKEANDTSLMLKIKKGSLTAEEYAQATEKYGIDHSEIIDQIDFEGQNKVEFDESIPNLDVDKERQALRTNEPKFQEQYTWNDEHMKTLLNGRVEFPNGKTICSFQEHEQAVKDTFGGIEDAINTYEYNHSSGDKVVHTEVYYKAFKSYVDEHGSITWKDTKQLTENDIMDDYLSNYPDHWSEKEKLTAFQDACPQLFWVRHVIDSSSQLLLLDQLELIRRFNENFLKNDRYGLILGWNA